MSNNIHQEIKFQASLEDVYQALTQDGKFAKFTNAPAEISPAVGGAFTCFGGQVVGRNIELVPNQRLVQAWRAATWEEGVWSIVRFELKSCDDGTQLMMEHTGFPDGAREHLEGGWHKMYWEPLCQFLS